MVEADIPALYRRRMNVFGAFAYHSWAELLVIDRVIVEQEIQTVIEFGPLRGGTTVFMAMSLMKNGGKVLSYDIQAKQSGIAWNLLTTNGHIEFFQGDIFLEPRRSEIIDNLQDTSLGRTLLYCDNGNKTLEVNLFSPYVRDKSLVAAHDFENDMGLNTEIWEHEIIDVLKAHRFHRVYKEAVGIGFYRKS